MWRSPSTSSRAAPQAPSRNKRPHHGGGTFSPPNIPPPRARGVEGIFKFSEPRKKRPRKGTAFCVVRVIGFEPIRDRSRGILSPLRLPVSPYSQKTCCLGQIFGRRAESAAKARASRRTKARSGGNAARGAGQLAQGEPRRVRHRPGDRKFLSVHEKNLRPARRGKAETFGGATRI